MALGLRIRELPASEADERAEHWLSAPRAWPGLRRPVSGPALRGPAQARRHRADPRAPAAPAADGRAFRRPSTPSSGPASRRSCWTGWSARTADRAARHARSRRGDQRLRRRCTCSARGRGRRSARRHRVAIPRPRRVLEARGHPAFGPLLRRLCGTTSPRGSPHGGPRSSAPAGGDGSPRRRPEATPRHDPSGAGASMATPRRSPCWCCSRPGRALSAAGWARPLLRPAPDGGGTGAGRPWWPAATCGRTSGRPSLAAFAGPRGRARRSGSALGFAAALAPPHRRPPRAGHDPPQRDSPRHPCAALRHLARNRPRLEARPGDRARRRAHLLRGLQRGAGGRSAARRAPPHAGRRTEASWCGRSMSRRSRAGCWAASRSPSGSRSPEPSSASSSPRAAGLGYLLQFAQSTYNAALTIALILAHHGRRAGAVRVRRAARAAPPSLAPPLNRPRRTAPWRSPKPAMARDPPGRATFVPSDRAAPERGPLPPDLRARRSDGRARQLRHRGQRRLGRVEAQPEVVVRVRRRRGRWAGASGGSTRPRSACRARSPAG